MPAPDGPPRAWHRDLVETAPVPVVVYDTEGVLRHANDAAVGFVNAATREAVVGRRAVEFVAPDDRERIGERVRRVLEERESVPPTEAAFVAVDGARKHAVTAGAPVTYEGEVAGQAVLNDVTERKARERRLERERDRFETLFENLPSPVVHGVVRDGEPVVEGVNRRFEEVFGHDREAVVGESLDSHIVPPDRRAEAERLNRRVLEEGRLRTEVSREAADGRRDFLLHTVLRDPASAEPEGYAIYVDITERKRAQRELERQNERLDEFASVVAHDLRNPLNVARSHLELALEGHDGADLDAVARAHDRMERIIDDLLTLARQGGAVTDPGPADLAAVARRAWRTVDTAEADLRVEGVGQVSADEDRLRRLFENLFRNAVEHGSTSNRTESGDSVEHGSTGSRAEPGDAVEHGSTSNRTESGDSVEHGSTGSRAEPGDSVEYGSTGSRSQTDDSVEHGGAAVTVTVGPLADGEGFYVADDGAGIPGDERDRVFESGYTTADGGTGFGLSIVRRIAEAHGWRVSVAESAAGGARFEFRPDAPGS